MSNCAKFRSNPSTEYIWIEDTASREITVNRQRTTDGRSDGQPENIMLSAVVVGGGIKRPTKPLASLGSASDHDHSDYR